MISASLGRDSDRNGSGNENEAVAGTEKGGKQGGAAKDWPRLEILYSQPQPRPVLNRPVVLNSEGKVPVAEKGEGGLLQR